MTLNDEAKEEGTRKVIAGLHKHFGRLPTDVEVMAFLFGSPEKRQEIYDNKGLPE